MRTNHYVPSVFALITALACLAATPAGLSQPAAHGAAPQEGVERRPIIAAEKDDGYRGI